MFAGQIAEQLGWRWGFWMVVPPALIAILLYRIVLPPDGEQRVTRLDWTGFLTLSIAIASAQLVFSRGQRLDWFESSEIVVATFVAVIALYIFLTHALTSPTPFVRVALFRDRNYAVGMVFVTLFGMLNFAPMVLLPPLLQSYANFSDSLVGEIIGWRGVGAAVGFGAAIFMNWIDARVRLMIGALLQTATGLHLLGIDVNTSMIEVSFNCFMQGLSVGLAWVPMTVLAFQTLPPEHRGEGMSLFHLMRNFGSSLFISIAVAEIVRTAGANYARLGENVSHYNRVMELPWAMGSWNTESAAGLARIAGEITRQATQIGYANAWLMYSIVSAVLIPLCLIASSRRKAA
jgi:DHA2 family multidrug resistance protein